MVSVGEGVVFWKKELGCTVPTKNLIRRNWGAPPAVRRLVSGRFGAMPKRRNERLAKQVSVMLVPAEKIPCFDERIPCSGARNSLFRCVGNLAPSR